MAPFGVAVTKTIMWRGEPQEFSNVYHYDVNTLDLVTWNAIADKLVELEKVFFGSNVTFKQVRIFGPTNQGPVANVTRLIKDVSGTGAQTGGGLIPPEFAIVAAIYMGRNPATGRKTFLRKYWHVGRVTGITSGASVALGTDPMLTGTTDYYKDRMNGLKTITAGAETLVMVKPSGGQIPIGSDAYVLPHLHVRQFLQ